MTKKGFPKLKLYLEIAGHVSELNKSKKKKISASQYFLNGEKRVFCNIGRMRL